MRATRSCIIALIVASLMAFSTEISVFAKDAPETTLLREGKLFDAAQLLQKTTKDPTAQTKAAELYFQLALYEEAIGRLVVAGASVESASITAVSEAFAQGNRSAALGVAMAHGLEPQARAEYARRELAEGHARAALALARESGNNSLLGIAGRAAYKECVEAGSEIASYGSSSPRHLQFSPDGRFLVLNDEDLSSIEVIDTRLRPELPAEVRGRIVDTGLTVEGFSINDDGRFLASFGLLRDKSGKGTPALRMERLDTGLLVSSQSLSGKAPKGRFRGIVFAGDSLCLAAEKALVLVNPWTGSVIASAAVPEGIASIEYESKDDSLLCGLSSRDGYRVYDATNLQTLQRERPRADSSPFESFRFAGAGLLRDLATGTSLYVPSSSLEELRVSSALDGGSVRTGPLSPSLVNASPIFYSGGVDAALSPDGLRLAILAREGIVLAPFPFLDREESAARLAKEFGLTESFAPLCGYLVDEGELEEAKRLWTLAGVDEKTIYRMFAESRLRLGAVVEAGLYFIEAGDAEKARGIADGIVAAAETGQDLKKAYESAETIYEKAGGDSAHLALLTGRRAEGVGDFPAAAEYYAVAGAREDLERLAFDPRLASLDWCLATGSKIGMSEQEIYSRAVELLEQQKKWGDAARARLWLRDDEGLGRVAKTALSGTDWDYKVLDAVKARGNPSLSRTVAELLMAKGEFLYAVEQYAAVNDLSGVARVADRALDADDFVFASELYSSLGQAGAKAVAAARLKLVYDELEALFDGAASYLAQETIDGVGSGRILVQWPISGAKAEAAAYQQMKAFGEALIALPSKPRSSEVKRCASYLSKEAIKGARLGGSDRTSQLLGLSTRYTFAARLLAAMGR